MKNKYTLRLKDIENISKKQPNYSIVIKEVLGFNNFKIGRKHIFEKKFKEAHFLITEARKINPKDVLFNEKCSIKKPLNIDNISFRAMMELQSLMSTYNNMANDFSEFIARIIATVCYQENYKLDYDSNSIEFNNFYNKILESPIWDMVGLYNWIDDSLKKSDLQWSERFLSVQVEDKEYEEAGGNRMHQFNVLNTIKSTCADFNCSYNEAWQMSYALTQTNSYAKATQNHIQDQMRILKEARMKKNKKSNNYN